LYGRRAICARRRERKASKELMLQTLEARVRAGALTPKERECLRLVAQQRSSKEIARELGISKASVDTYCNRARAKLGVATRRLAAQLVIDLEVETAEPPPAAVEAPQPAPAIVTVTPALSSLGALARLAIILGGAVVLALAFGMLITGLQTLDEFARAAAAKPAVEALSPEGR
jgi:DNA-binding CsgD family transcriptional regulator